jgi:Outer membrane protein (porin)
MEEKMKKALLAAALMTAGVVAHAQSSVTLYGRLDAGLEYMTGVPQGVGANGQATGSTNRFKAESGDWGTSLWGMKGVEDIGGGNKVLFQLEGSFNTMTGGPWRRRSLQSLGNGRLVERPYGTFTMGRMLYISNGVWDFDPFGQSNWSSASLVRGRNWPQSSNNFAYQSPKIAGFDFYGQYALSNATNWNGNGTTAQGREAGAQVTYTNSLFQVRGHL